MAKIEELKESNIQLIRGYFYDTETWTKNRLSDISGLSLAAVTNILACLKETGEILQIEDARSTGGRKSKQYCLNKDHAHLLSILLRRKKEEDCAEGEVSDLYGNVLYSFSRTYRQMSVENFLQNLKDVLQKDPKIAQIAVSVPGICMDGILKECDCPLFEYADLGSMIRKMTDIPFVIENDVNAAAIGSAHTYGKGKNLLFVYQPEEAYAGVGILIDGRLYNGSTHRAGEVRFLPQWTEKEQDALLQSNARYLLEQQIMTLCAVLDPEAVLWCSDVLEDIHPVFRGNCCEVIKVTDIHKAIARGLYEIGKNSQKNRKRGNG